MTDLQRWAKDEIDQIEGEETLCGAVSILGTISAPVGGWVLVAITKALSMKGSADKYYLAELHKIHRGTRFTKVTWEEAKRLGQ